MRTFICPSPAAFLLCLILSASSALGQTLSIVKAGTNYTIDASAPAGNPHTLQASENLHLWVDVREDVQDLYHYALDQAGVKQRYFRLKPAGEPPPELRVMLIGDSMSSECCGWGRGFPQFFKESAIVINYAQPWTSTKVFLQSAEMDKMLLVKPEYVLIQFAWSDATNDPDRGTTAEEFGNNLRTLVQTVRSFNGIPILITLHGARLWDSEGHLLPSQHPYNAVTRQVSTELNTPFIDLYQLSTALYLQLGADHTDFMHFEFGAPDDNMHLSQLGAAYISQVLVRALPDSFGPYLKGIFDRLPEP